MFARKTLVINIDCMIDCNIDCRIHFTIILLSVYINMGKIFDTSYITITSEIRMFLTLQKILGILISPSLAVKFTKSKFPSVALLNLKCVYAKK